MKILFDQGTPAPLRYALKGHIVHTAYEMGWSSLRNGDLIRAALEEGFHCMVTTDQQLPYQQRLNDILLSILILPTTSWPKIRQHKEYIADTVETLSPGICLRLDLPTP